MEPQLIWMLLNDLAGRLGVEVRLERLEDGEEFNVRGGLCRLGPRLVAFVDRRLTVAGRNRQLGLALAGQDLNGLFLRPALREFLEGLQPEHDRGDQEP
jgi:hypothetical protein